METLSLKGVRRRKKKVLIVNKDLAPAHPMSSSSVSAPKPEGRDKPLTIKKKKAKVALKPQPKKVLPTKKPRKPPPSPPILKQKRIERILKLCEVYPDLFSVENPKPLAIGVADELIAQEGRSLSKKVIRSGIQHYTNLPQYHRAIVKKQVRINACGIDAATPEPEHIEHSKKRLGWWLTLPERWPCEWTQAIKLHPTLFEIA